MAFSESYIKEVQDFFFLAAMNGYAGSAPKGTIVELPRSKTITFTDGDWKAVDVYYTIPNNPWSFGQKVIWRGGIPVWEMSYYGQYPERAKPTLKKALMRTYEKKIFEGGRGLNWRDTEKEMSYGNTLDMGNGKNDFSYFKGMEYISTSELSGAIGWHEYSGMLIPLE